MFAPLTLWYALGFRWDPLSGHLVKVGAAFVKSYPSGAKIFRDGQNTGKKTAHQLINIPEGDHEFLILKEGYEPWSKRLPVEAGKTTFIEDVVLFKTAYEKNSFTTYPNNALLLSPSKEAYAFISGANLLVYDTQRVDPLTDMNVATSTSLKHWSTNQRSLVIKNPLGWSSLNVETKDIKQLAETADDLQTTDGTTFWKLDKGILSRIETDGSIHLLATDTAEFLLTTDLLTVNHEGLLTLSSLEGKTAWQQQLPAESHLIDYRQGLALVRSGQEILLVTDQGIKERLNANLADWKGNKILFSNDFEIWSYSTDSQKLDLIDRTGNRLQKVFWHPSLSYLTVAQNNQLYLMEIDNRGQKRHRIFLSQVQADDSFTYNKKGDEITIISPEEHYRLTIQ